MGLAQRVSFRIGSSRQSWLVLAICAVALALRLGISFALMSPGLGKTDADFIAQYKHDEQQYLSLGQALATTGEFSSPYVPVANRAPGWPFLLSLWFRTFGVNESYRILQALLGTLLCVEVYAFALQLFSKNGIALLASVISAVWPQFVLNSAVAYSDTLYLVLWLAAYFVALTIIRVKNWRLVLLLAMLLAASAYVRPQGLTYIPLGVLAICVSPGAHQFSLRGRCGKSIVFVTAVMLLIAPWVYRNYRVTGRLSPLAENSVFYQNYNPTLLDWSLFDYRFFIDSQPEDDAETEHLVEKCLEAHGSSPYDQTYPCRQQIAMEFISKHPDVVIRLAFARLVKYWIPAHLGYSTRQWIALTVAWLFVFPAAIVFMFSGQWSRQRLVLAGPVVVEMSLAVAIATQIRYRMPSEVALIIASAAVWWMFGSRFVRR